MRIQHEAEVPAEFALSRLDQSVAKMFPEYSRARLQGWIKSGELTVDGQQRRPRDKLMGGEQIVIAAEVASLTDAPEAMALNIVFEDDSILVLNKPEGLVVHPGAGNRTGTLLNGLLAHVPALESVPRAGIVHRLDKDTTGLMVVAKTLSVQLNLVEQLQARTVSRVYEALVYGQPPRQGSVDAPIARHPGHRTRMTVLEGGKEALTHYRLLEQFEQIAHMEFALATGRTHQIRVHMRHLGLPLVGDAIYGGTLRTHGSMGMDLRQHLQALDHQVLHARRLSFVHPDSGETVSFVAELPTYFRDLLDLLAVRAPYV